MTIYGYARVSTSQQSLESQYVALMVGGCVARNRIESDIASGGAWGADRPGLSRLLPRLESGDVLMVTALDRVARRLLNLLEFMEVLAMRGIELCSLAENFNTSSASGSMAVQMAGVLAEFERKRLGERVANGMRSARALGVHVGRPALFNPRQVRVIRRMAAEGESTGTIARSFNTHRSTIRRILDGKRPYHVLPKLTPAGQTVAWAAAEEC